MPIAQRRPEGDLDAAAGSGTMDRRGRRQRAFTSNECRTRVTDQWSAMPGVGARSAGPPKAEAERWRRPTARAARRLDLIRLNSATQGLVSCHEPGCSRLAGWAELEGCQAVRAASWQVPEGGRHRPCANPRAVRDR